MKTNEKFVVAEKGQDVGHSTKRENRINDTAICFNYRH